MMISVNIDMAATGKNIKKLMKKNRYTHKKLCAALGLSTVQATYKWTQGKVLPSIDNQLVLAWIFHVRIEDLLVYTVNGIEANAA